MPGPLSIELMWIRLKAALSYNINKVYLNETECYMIKPYDDCVIYFNADTGLTVREDNYDNTYETINYIYERGTVTDEDVQRPDVTKYEKVTSTLLSN